ncbi:MAG: hypothetical protein Q7K43_04235 [Candidatus Woesearchaeota archaeon]|nr:hypothetical protein [Candidatus Woesearchaeota archaeon]
MNFKVIDTENYTSVHSEANGYRLEICFGSEDNPPGNIEFFVDPNEKLPKGLWISARDSEDYLELNPEQILPGNTLIEVGAGLGGMVSKALERNAFVTVIDPANYELMQDMLAHAIEQPRVSSIMKRIQIVKERCELALSDRVRLLNKPLLEVLEQNPELCGTADIVVDHMAAVFYARKLGCVSQVLAAEQALLKPEGTLYLYPLYHEY